MDPIDYGLGASSFFPDQSGTRKRDLFEPPFNLWPTGNANPLAPHTSKKPRYDSEEQPGIKNDVKDMSLCEDEDDEEEEMEFERIKNSAKITSDRDELKDLEVELELPSTAHKAIKENVEPDPDEQDDPEQDASSPSTTPPQSSSEPEPTPRSSNEGDGEKSDKADMESCKSLQVTHTSNGSSSIINYISPSMTKRSVTLQMLLAAGILKPGEGTMSLEYHGQKFIGDLLDNGQIRSQETSQIFSSPSAWATTCKQIINPDKSLKKSGCGWASIKYKSLKLDYYKAVWFKRLREGSIDIRSITNGAVSSSSDEEDETPHFVLKFGEHFENNPRHQTAQQLGAKVLISCTEFKEMERLQPFHVNVSAEAMALADFHCNITNTEAVGYISGQWNGDQNTLKMETVHPCRVLMPTSTTVDCDNERNRIALEIQRLGHEVVGWYHSHPKAPPIPSKDDIARQLDYQIMMKGATEASYIPCVGIIISPLCYTEQNDIHKSLVQFFWTMPPPENRPLEMGRPMHIEYEINPSAKFDPSTLVLNMKDLVEFYKGFKELVEINELGTGKLDRLKETITTWLPVLKFENDFWSEIQQKSKEVYKPVIEESSTLVPVSLKGNSSTSGSSSPAQTEEDNFKESRPEVELDLESEEPEDTENNTEDRDQNLVEV